MMGRTLQVCVSLAQVAKHNLDLAETVVEADVLPNMLTCLRFPDAAVQSAAMQVVREVVKHSSHLAQVVVSAGAIPLMVEAINVRSISAST